MEWISAHIEALIAIGSAVAGFASWNIGQGFRIKAVEGALTAHEKHGAEKTNTLEKEIALLRSHYENNQVRLTEELRRIGEKLAHIEGIMTAQNNRPTARNRG